MATKPDPNDIFRNALGLNNDAGTYAGGAVTLAGLIGSFIATQNEKTYTQSTKDAQSAYENVGVEASARGAEASSALTANLAGYETQAESGIKQGLVNRGITDSNVGNSATSQFKAGMSGAYAAANAALQGAKVNASNALARTKIQYLTDLTQKQHASVMQKYYNQMGIWGALGSIGGGLMGMPSTSANQPSSPLQDYTSDLGNYDENSGSFRMKGIQDSEPFKMKGVQ